MFKRQTAFDMGKFLTGEGRGADEPNASLDNHGLSLRGVLCNAWGAASLNASEHKGPFALILWPLIGPPLRRLDMRR